MSRVHTAPKCNTALPWVRSNTPATREVDWMNGSRHNKNASRQTDAQRFLPLLERIICSVPSLRTKLRIFGVDYYRSFEAQKMVFGPALVLSARLRTLTVSIATRTSNGSCSDALTLLISDWLFGQGGEGGASCDWAAILSVAFFPIQNYTSDTSWVFYSLWYYATAGNLKLLICSVRCADIPLKLLQLCSEIIKS